MTDLTSEQIKQAIKAEVTNLGFLISGFTTPAPIEEFPKYQEWIRAGHHAEMHYLSRESALLKRQNPRLVFPDGKTILVLGIPYPEPKETEKLRIAAYAQGTDYHHLIPQQLSGFQPWLEEFLGHPVKMRIFTDTAPIMEKQLAVRAGLGWIGKNGLLINPKYGSFFFLTEIFMDIELPPDEPFTKDLCGNCSKCIENCPTNSILENRTLNANSCLSYLTIEKKGDFSDQEIESMTNYAFGCDMCQNVCPWNQKRKEANTFSTIFTPDDELNGIAFSDLLVLDEETFRQRYQNTPIFRTKRTGLLRNLLAIIANIGEEDDLEHLKEFIAHEQNENLRMIATHAQARISERLDLEVD